MGRRHGGSVEGSTPSAPRAEPAATERRPPSFTGGGESAGLAAPAHATEPESDHAADSGGSDSDPRNGDTVDENGRGAPRVGPNSADSDAESHGVAAPPSNTNPDETNVWPDEAAEAAFIAEARGRGEKVVPVAPEVIEEAEDSRGALPPLDELVQRIPAETRELLDELFRAKFIAVRRVRKSDLKPVAET